MKSGACRNTTDQRKLCPNDELMLALQAGHPSLDSTCTMHVELRLEVVSVINLCIAERLGLIRLPDW